MEEVPKPHNKSFNPSSNFYKEDNQKQKEKLGKLSIGNHRKKP